MPEFIMDKSGRVECSDPHKPCVCAFATFDRLPTGAQGYFEAMFFTEESPGLSTEQWEAGCERGSNDGALPGDVGFSDLDASALAKGIADWLAFEAKARDLLELAYARDDYDEEQAGRDFWFTRNGHGVGFWDREQLEEGGLGDKLSAIARTFADVAVYFEDGKIYS
jgi:hypothetical protein